MDDAVAWLRLVFAVPRGAPDGGEGRMYVIDLFRGLAATTVLFWHYQGLFVLTPGSEMPAALRPAQPLYPLFRILYEHGYLAVQLFWMISGFVFCAVYAHRRATTRDFVVNRIARLYPLHLLTLLVVAGLQIVSVRTLGQPQLFAHNDAWHFCLQLFMASAWGFQSGDSFNGPIWSVSVEILIYALFWASRPFLYRHGALGPGLMAVACYALMRYPGFVPASVWECGFYFFAGAATLLVVRPVGNRGWLILPAASAAIVASVAIGLLAPGQAESVAKALLILGLLLAACALEAFPFAKLARRLAWVGDNSYGCYLWHMPIIIMLMIGMDLIAGNRAAALSPVFLIAFIGVTLLVARLSFVGFEQPMRRLIRRRFDPVAPREAIAAP